MRLGAEQRREFVVGGHWSLTSVSLVIPGGPSKHWEGWGVRGGGETALKAQTP